MLYFNSIRWRIKLRTRRKKNRVKQIKNERVMLVSVKSGYAGICSTSCKHSGQFRASRRATGEALGRRATPRGARYAKIRYLTVFALRTH
ncbi:hypothetical protein Hanom_Chr06g00577581 [Helianthus anomalus]